MSTDKKTSILIREQFPEFLRNENSAFINFVEAYYEWMEQNDNTIDVSKNLLYNQDVDTSVEEYLDFFDKEILPSLPKNFAADKINFLKHAKEFYQSRGNMKSFELLFRLLWDEDVEVFFPHKLILKASDGKWVRETSVTVSTPICGNIFDLEGQYIFSKVTDARARVDHIHSFVKNGRQTWQLYLVDVYKEFADEEVIYNIDESICATVYGIAGGLSSVVITEGGANHKLGNAVEIDEIAGTGSGAKGFISRIGAGSSVEFNITNGGFGYELNNTLINVTGGSGYNANWRVTELANTRPYTYYFDRIHTMRGVVIGTIGGYQQPTLSAKAGKPGSIALADTTYSPGPYANSVVEEWLYAANRPTPDETQIYRNTWTGMYYSVIDQSRYTPSANIVIANAYTPLNKALGSEEITIGRISAIETTNVGYGYELTLPNTTAINPRFKLDTVDIESKDTELGWNLDQLQPDYGTAFSGTLGRNAIIEASPGFGTIEEVQVTDPGNGAYVTGKDVSIRNVSPNAPGTYDGYGNARTTGFYKHPGRYIDTNGFLSWTHKLQDNYYYQQFSYVLFSNILKSKYTTLVEKLVHPSGRKRFDVFRDNPFADVSVTVVGIIETDEAVQTSLNINLDLSIVQLPAQDFTTNNWIRIYPFFLDTFNASEYDYVSSEPLGAETVSTTALAIVNTHIIGWFPGTGLLYSNTNYNVGSYDDKTIADIEDYPIDLYGTRVMLYTDGTGTLLTEFANTYNPQAIWITQDNISVDGYFQTVWTLNDTHLLIRTPTYDTSNQKVLLSGATFKYPANTATSNSTLQTGEEIKWHFDWDSEAFLPINLVNSSGYPDY